MAETTIQPYNLSIAKSIIGPLAQTNHFLVSFSSLTPSVESYLRSYTRISGLKDFLSRRMGILCSDASLPTSTLATAEVKDNFMGVPQQFAHTRFYTDISYKLNLCSQYKVTPNEDGTKHGGECVGKKEIDSASASGVGLSIVFEITLFERVTDDSVWKIFSVSQGETQTQVSGLKLKNHKNLDVGLLSGSTEFISYTYRF